MKEFKTLDDIVEVEGEQITRDEFDNLINNGLVVFWDDVTSKDWSPKISNCTTYDVRVNENFDGEDYFWMYVFVKDEKKDLIKENMHGHFSVRDWNTMVDSILFDNKEEYLP